MKIIINTSLNYKNKYINNKIAKAFNMSKIIILIITSNLNLYKHQIFKIKIINKTLRKKVNNLMKEKKSKLVQIQILLSPQIKDKMIYVIQSIYIKMTIQQQLIFPMYKKLMKKFKNFKSYSM